MRFIDRRFSGPYSLYRGAVGTVAAAVGSRHVSPRNASSRSRAVSSPRRQ
ncbi:hypothetical protein ACFQL0_17660 [Haloplanus litoreus]